jgi:plastocyanin
MRAHSLLLLALMHVCAPVAAGERHMIVIDAMEFKPRTLSVRAGDTVTFTNKGPFPHTAASVKPAFSSPEIGSGKSWSMVVRGKGDVDYICTLHPTMKARLTIR